MFPTPTGLPDPETHAELYADVALKRALAWVVDSVLIAGLTLLVLPLTFFAGLFFLPLLWLLIGLPYRIVTIARHSATPGMRLMGIALRGPGGGPLSPGESVVHTAVFWVAMSIPPLLLVSVVLILLSPRGQGLPDLVVGSSALNRTI